MGSLDRNAQSAVRVRRNAQRTRAGDLTGSIKVSAPITNAGGKLGVSIDGTTIKLTGSQLVVGNLAESQVTNLVTDLASKVPAVRNVNTTSPLTGGGALSADLTLGVALAAAGAIVNSGGLAVNLTANGGLQVVSDGLGVKVDGTTVTINGTGQLVSSGGTPYTPPVTTKGDIFVYGAAATRLPVGTDGQELSADSSAATGLRWTARTAMKNRLVNGNFDFWQRGTTSSALGYIADRWNWTAGGTGATGTVSQYVMALGEVGGNVPAVYGLQWAITAGTAGQPTLEQRIEGVRSLAGQQVAFSFWAKCGTAGLAGSIVASQVFGTGGSPSAAVATTIGTFTTATGWTRYTATVALPALTGKTLGTNGDDYLAIQFLMPATTSFTLTLAQAQLEPGFIASDFEFRPAAFELQLCQRYYCKSYNVNVNPGTATHTGEVRYPANKSAQGEQNVTVFYPVSMRAVPTVTLYSPSTGASANIADLSAAADVAAPGVNSQSVRYHSGGPNLTLGDVYAQQFTCNAEL